MPESFGDGLIGHATIIRLLTAWVTDPAPAYLFIGAQHLGKRAIAERFVRVLLGREIHDSHWKAHADLVLLEPEEGKSLVSVEQVRDARTRLSMRPMTAPRIVAYIPYADRLNESGMNALLKILEEPPADAVFVLVAEDAGRVPATVKSRCVSVPFEHVPSDQIVVGLEARGISPTDAMQRARNSHGKPGLAIEPIEIGEQPGRIFVQEFLTAISTGARLGCVERLVSECESAADSVSAWREALQAAIETGRNSFESDPYRTTLFGLALVTAIRSVGSAVSPRFALDACAVRLAGSVEAQLPSLFPSHLPSALPLMYTSPIV